MCARAEVCKLSVDEQDEAGDKITGQPYIRKNTPRDTNTPILFRSLAGLTRRNVSSKAGPAGLVPLAELDGPGTPRVPPARAGDDDGCGTENVVFSPARSQNEDLLSA